MKLMKVQDARRELIKVVEEQFKKEGVVVQVGVTYWAANPEFPVNGEIEGYDVDIALYDNNGVFLDYSWELHQYKMSEKAEAVSHAERLLEWVKMLFKYQEYVAVTDKVTVSDY